MNINRSITKYEFSEICEKIENIIYNFFDKNVDPYNFSRNEDEEKWVDLSKRKQTIYLSNSDVISYNISRNNLAHLLGINTEYLISKGIYDKNLTSFDILERIVRNSSTLYAKHEQGIIDLRKVISPYIKEKIVAFETNSFINFNHISLICKYDNSRSYGFNDDYDISYMIIQEIDDKYYLLIISVDENGQFVPVSSQFYNSYNELSDSLSDKIINQEFLLATGMTIKQGYQDAKRLWLNQEARKNKLNKLKDLSKDFNCIPNVLHDYLYSQKILFNSKLEKNINNDVLLEISSLMKKRKPIYLSEMKKGNYVTDEIKCMIDAYNDSLFDNNLFDEDKTFSSIKKENKDLKEKLDEALKELEQLNILYNDLKSNYADQEKELEILKNKIEEAKKILS